MTAPAIDSNTLKSLPVLTALTRAQATWLLPTVRCRSYAPRACVLRAGEPADGLHYVLSGSAKIVHEDGRGRELVTNVLGPGDFFGEMGLLDGQAHPASVHAAEPCSILHVPRRIVLECAEENAAVAYALLQAALERLCGAHAKMARIALVDVYGRVSQVLLEEALETDGEWTTNLGAETIAGLVGASREMVSRVIRHMVARGAVRRHGRTLVICDRAALGGLPPDAA